MHKVCAVKIPNTNLLRLSKSLYEADSACQGKDTQTAAIRPRARALLKGTKPAEFRVELAKDNLVRVKGEISGSEGLLQGEPWDMLRSRPGPPC